MAGLLAEYLETSFRATLRQRRKVDFLEQTGGTRLAVGSGQVNV